MKLDRFVRKVINLRRKYPHLAMSVKEYAVIWYIAKRGKSQVSYVDRRKKRIKPRCILEVGTGRGFGTRVLHEACPSAIIHSIDNLQDVTKEEWGKYVRKLHNVRLIEGESTELIAKLCKNNNYCMAVLDNGHTKEVVCKNVKDTAHIPMVIIHNGLNPEILEAIHECSEQRFVRIDPFPAVDEQDEEYLNKTHWKGLGIWVKT